MNKLAMAAIFALSIFCSSFGFACYTDNEGEEIDLESNKVTLAIHYPNHTYCHIQLFIIGGEYNYKNLRSSLIMEQGDDEILPLLVNFHGIESNVGVHWLYMGEYTLRTKDNSSFGDTLARLGLTDVSKLVLLPILCNLPHKYRRTH